MAVQAPIFVCIGDRLRSRALFLLYGRTLAAVLPRGPLTRPGCRWNSFANTAMVRMGLMECQGNDDRPAAADAGGHDRISGYGEMAERFKAAVSKTVVGASSTVGSNPTLSARHCTATSRMGFCVRLGSRSAERCRSGRTGTTGNRVGAESLSRVRIPPSPPVCDISPCTCAPASARIASLSTDGRSCNSSR